MVAILFLGVALAMVIVGVLIMTQALGLEQLGSAIWRFVILLWAVIVLCFLVRLVLLPILVCLLIELKTAMLSVLVIVILAIVLLVALRFALSKAINGPEKHEKGE